MARPASDRVFDHVGDWSHPAGCWIWTGFVGRDGYGLVWGEDQRHYVRPHRVMYERFVGPIPDELVLDHLCREPLCVNPLHLEAVTIAENNRRGWWGDRPTCKRGHVWTVETEYWKDDGRRRCLLCRAEYQREYRSR